MLSHQVEYISRTHVYSTFPPTYTVVTVPYVIGVSGLSQDRLQNSCNDCVIVNLDDNYLYIPQEQNFPQMPREQQLYPLLLSQIICFVAHVDRSLTRPYVRATG